MAKRKIKIGIVCLTRNTFDYKAAEDIYRGIVRDLSARDDIVVAAYPDPVMLQDEAVAAGEYLRGEGVEAVAVLSGTFHLGILALEIKKPICTKAATGISPTACPKKSTRTGWTPCV